MRLTPQKVGLNPFSDPTSVAVVGATADTTKWGYWLARGALRGRHRRCVNLVNRHGATVGDVASYTSVDSLPSVPELTVVCVPGPSVPDVVEAAIEKGSRAFLVISADVADEEGLAERIRSVGGRLVGPNSLGIYYAAHELELAWGNFLPGRLAVVSQSGQLGSEIAMHGIAAGTGLSRFVSVGNQLDTRAAEVVTELASDEDTSVVAVYLESFEGATEIIDALRAVRAAGKYALVLSPGASDASRRLAWSHTGSMTSPTDLVDAACRAAGALRVASPAALVAIASYLERSALPHGDTLAVVSDSGGQGAIAADLATQAGLRVPEFPAELQRNLDSRLPKGAACSNPIDLAGAGEADLSVYARIVSEFASNAEPHAILLSGYFGCYGLDIPPMLEDELAAADELIAAASAVGRPVVVHSLASGGQVVEYLRSNGIAVFTRVDDVITALTAARSLRENSGRHVRTVDAATEPLAPDPVDLRDQLQARGIPFAPGVVATERAGIREAGMELPAPYVLKAGWLQHKTEQQGVVLGLNSVGELLDAFDAMHARLGEGRYLVECQDTRAHVVEMLAAGRNDALLGPVVTVGGGGTEAELRRDLRIELAPVDLATAHTMIRSLDCLPLLSGWRSQPAADVDALARLVVRLSEEVAAQPMIGELEINPVRVGPSGAVAVDCLVSTAGKSR